MGKRKTQRRVGLAGAACALAALGWSAASVVGSPAPSLASGGRPEIRRLYFPSGCVAPNTLRVGAWRSAAEGVVLLPMIGAIQPGGCLEIRVALAPIVYACCVSPDLKAKACTATDMDAAADPSWSCSSVVDVFGQSVTP